MKGKVTSRREFMRMGLIGVGGSVLAACAPKTVPTAAPAEQGQPAATQASEQEQPAATQVPEQSAPAEAPQAGVTIEYWYGWGSNYTDAVWENLKKTDEFKEAIGNNTLETKGSVTAEAFLTAVASGAPPEGASNTEYVQFMSRGVLLPIDEWMAASKVFAQADHIESVWNNAFYKGKMYGAPANENFVWYGLNYNAKLVEEAGLDPDRPPETWAEALDWHKALTKFDAAGNLIRIGLDPYDAMAGEPDFCALSWGWPWFDEETGKHDLNNEHMIDVLNTLGEFYKIAGPDNMAGMRQVEGQGGWGGSYNAEVQAMIIEGYWHPGETQMQKPEVAQYNRSTWAPVPEARRGHKIQGAGGHYVIFFQDAKNPEPMFRVSEFLNTDAACEIIFQQVGWLPSRKSFMDKVDPKAYPGLEFYLKGVQEVTDWLRGGRRSPIHWFIVTQYTELREAVFRGQKTAAEAAAELQSRADAEWEAQGLS